MGMDSDKITVKCFLCGADIVIGKDDYEIADVENNTIACWKHLPENER